MHYRSMIGFSQIQSEGLVAVLVKLGSQKAGLSPKDLVSDSS